MAAYPRPRGRGTARASAGRDLGGWRFSPSSPSRDFWSRAVFERQPTVGSWVRARVLRLLPALFVVLLLTVAVLGPLVTDLPLAAYLADPATWTYVPNNLSLGFLQYDLPGRLPGSAVGRDQRLALDIVLQGRLLRGCARRRPAGRAEAPLRDALALIGFALCIRGDLLRARARGRRHTGSRRSQGWPCPSRSARRSTSGGGTVFLHSGLFAVLIVATGAAPRHTGLPPVPCADLGLWRVHARIPARRRRATVQSSGGLFLRHLHLRIPRPAGDGARVPAAVSAGEHQPWPFPSPAELAVLSWIWIEKTGPGLGANARIFRLPPASSVRPGIRERPGRARPRWQRTRTGAGSAIWLQRLSAKRRRVRHTRLPPVRTAHFGEVPVHVRRWSGRV